MGWTDQQLPFASSSSPTASHCSYLGAVHAASRAKTQTQALLEVYEQWGPMTDQEAAEFLGLPRSTINARRRPLVLAERVAAHGTKPGIAGVKNTVWGLA